MSLFMKAVARRVHYSLKGVDITFASLIFGSKPPTTISDIAGKAMLSGERWGCILCRFLELFEKDHCLKAIEPDEGSAPVAQIQRG
jgi:hypothetical protein